MPFSPHNFGSAVIDYRRIARLVPKTQLVVVILLVGVLLVACDTGDPLIGSQPSERISRLRVFEPSPENLKRGRGILEHEKNGEALVVRTLIDPYDTVIDVGAYIGNWSLMVNKAQPSTKIYAFEPAPETFPKLEKRLQGTQIILLKLALSDQAGIAEFFYYPDSDILSSLYQHKKLTFREVIQVDVTTSRLDTWCRFEQIDRVDFLKIDTEGAELLIIRGSSDMLEDKSIGMLQFEYAYSYEDAGITLREVFDLISAYDYDIYRILPNGLLRIPEWQDGLEDYVFANYLAVAR